MSDPTGAELHIQLHHIRPTGHASLACTHIMAEGDGPWRPSDFAQAWRAISISQTLQGGSHCIR